MPADEHTRSCSVKVSHEDMYLGFRTFDITSLKLVSISRPTDLHLRSDSVLGTMLQRNKLV